MNKHMKSLKSLKYIIPALFVAIGVWSCGEDFLDRPPGASLVDATFFKDDNQVLAATAPLYSRTWFGYLDKASFAIGDGRAGIYRGGWTQYVRNSVEPTDPDLRACWSAFWSTVAHCNSTIRNINAYAGPDVSDGIKRHGIAEARFMRGLAYLYLVRLWGPVPIIEDNTKILTDTTVGPNTEESVFEFAIRDFTYAAENLPSIAVQDGRLTEWSAKGMLARAYLTRASFRSHGSGQRDQSDLDAAKQYAGDVCKNSGLELMEDYWELFRTQNDNNQESLVALQWIYNAGYGGGNPLASQLAFSASVTGFDDGWGFWQGASSDIVRYYLDNAQDSIRRKATFFFNGDYYPYMHERKFDASGNTTYVPLIYNNSDDRATVKKYIPGPPIDNDGRSNRQSTDNNTYMLRLADVYLDYAEAIVGNQASTNDADALTYFNAVRTRAGMPELTTITWRDIFDEKRVEFAMEHSFWYEIVKWYYRDPEAAKDYVSNIDRSDPKVTLKPGTNPKEWQAVFPAAETYPLLDSKVFLPIPAVELSSAPNLAKTPVEYVFN
jgi:starch-binding outer membrane protein, SusD/RagB family